MDKDDVVPINKGILAIKKEGNNTMCSNIDGPMDDHTKMDLRMIYYLSQREKDKYHRVLLIGGILKLIQMNSFANQKQTHRIRKPI